MIVVTGGLGYLGSVLMPRLETMGVPVRVVDAAWFCDSGSREALPEHVRTDDVRDARPEWFLGRDGPADAVVHLAGFSNDPTAEAAPALNHAVNCGGTAAVARAAWAAGVKRLVLASSCSVYYGAQRDDAWQDEAFPVAPSAPYSASKRAAEVWLRDHTPARCTSVALRMGTLMGPSPRMRFDLVVNRMARAAALDGAIEVHAGGAQWRPMLHVEDAADAFVAACWADPDLARTLRTYNVVGENVQVLALAHRVAHAAGDRARVRVQYDAAGPPRSYRVRGDLAAVELGWWPRRTVEDAVRAICVDLAARTWGDPQDPRYDNLAWMSARGLLAGGDAPERRPA